MELKKEGLIMREEFFIDKNCSIKEAMKKMEKVKEKVLFIVDNNNRLCGSLTDGDIRRCILAEGDITQCVERAYNKNPIFVNQDYNLENVKQIMLDKRLKWIPVVNKAKEVTKVLLWSNIFGREEVPLNKKLTIPVAIMAGGKGARLDPFTRVLPKPLIPIGDKPIIDIIMDKFFQYGIEEFYISINHKSRMIKSYFEEANTKYTIYYIEEKVPLGTAGSLRFLKTKIKDSVLVTNCDIIINADYSELVNFHNNNNNDMTIVSSFRHYTIPYGICEIENGGTLKAITEKPEYDFLANTGMYILKKGALDLIPGNKLFHVTDLVRSLKDNKGRIGVFPISGKSWVDVGQWEEYRHTVKELEAEL